MALWDFTFAAICKQWFFESTFSSHSETFLNRKFRNWIITSDIIEISTPLYVIKKSSTKSDIIINELGNEWIFLKKNVEKLN